MPKTVLLTLTPWEVDHLTRLTAAQLEEDYKLGASAYGNRRDEVLYAKLAKAGAKVDIFSATLYYTPPYLVARFIDSLLPPSPTKKAPSKPVKKAARRRGGATHSHGPASPAVPAGGGSSRRSSAPAVAAAPAGVSTGSPAEVQA